MNKRDLVLVIVIGGAVGLLVQPIAANFIGILYRVLPVPRGLVRPILFLFFVVLAPVALWVAALIGKRIPVIYQFAKFAAVGSLNSFVDLGFFNLETLLYGSLPGKSMFAIFKSISFLIATTNSFVWNKYWTFSSSGAVQAGEAAKFYAIAISGWLLNVGVATFVRGLAPSGPLENAWVNLISPLAGIFTVLFWNFAGYKFFVFKKTESLPPPARI